MAKRLSQIGRVILLFKLMGLPTGSECSRCLVRRSRPELHVYLILFDLKLAGSILFGPRAFCGTSIRRVQAMRRLMTMSYAQRAQGW